jgi:hypothetical protein
MESPKPIKLTAEIGTETPTHFIESNHDSNYHWNEWDARRQIIKEVSHNKQSKL